MKRSCFAIFFSPLLCYGQGYLDSLPKLNKGDILILGEYHFVQEMQDVECEIIQKYTNEYEVVSPKVCNFQQK